MQKYFLHIVIGFGIIVVGIALAGLYRFYTTDDNYVVTDIGTIQKPDVVATTTETEAEVPEPTQTPGKIKADTFTGTLKKVDTGCFADGECFVEVDGKHVTVLMGWSQDTVGSVKGVPDFGALEKYIGKSVEVYAQEKVDGTYTLYGSEGFYVKVLTATIAPPKPTVGTGCMIGGCSGQLCVDASEGDRMTTCEWTEAYACYQTAKCEKQSSGSCGWTETTELKQCLVEAGSGMERI